MPMVVRDCLASTGLSVVMQCVPRVYVTVKGRA
jgi:hypothetical protein